MIIRSFVNYDIEIHHIFWIFISISLTVNIAIPGAIALRRLDNIDLRLLRVFVVLADAGGFADAQITLNLSQSTLSTHLAGLEKRIGAHIG